MTDLKPLNLNDIEDAPVFAVSTPAQDIAVYMHKSSLGDARRMAHQVSDEVAEKALADAASGKITLDAYNAKVDELGSANRAMKDALERIAKCALGL